MKPRLKCSVDWPSPINVKKKTNEKHQQKVWSKQVVIMYYVRHEYEFETGIWNSTPKSCGRKMWIQVCNSMLVIFFRLPQTCIRIWACFDACDIGRTEIKEKPPRTKFICKSFDKVRWSRTIKPFELPINDVGNRIFLMWTEFFLAQLTKLIANVRLMNFFHFSISKLIKLSVL